MESKSHGVLDHPLSRVMTATESNRMAWMGGSLSARPAPHCRSKLLPEFGEFVGGEIADRPIMQAALAPASDVESLKALGPGRAVPGASGLGHEQVDDMQAPPIHDRSDPVVVAIVEPQADQRKPLRSQVDDRRRHVQLAAEPRLHR